MTPADDYRSPAAHDFDRILYSSAYRRLAGVTQVVAVGEMQLFHNRMTHTQKVAQLSRRIAQYLNWDPRNEAARARLEDGRVDVDAAEAAGLAHDLGHPPFGHIAEQTLNRLCKDVDGYEGNAQSFRIVSKLSIRKTGPNLQLSRRTLDGILKYPWTSQTKRANDTGKWGAYQTESELFGQVRRPWKRSSQKSIEAEIMDWADDITYAVHDLEDFYRAGFINLRRLKDDPVFRREFVARALRDREDWDLEETEELFKGLFFFIPPKLEDYAGTIQDRRNVSRLGSVFIDRYVTNTTLAPDGTLRVDDDYQKEIHLLKQLTWQFVINDPALASLQQGQVRVIEELYGGLRSWVVAEADRQRLPTRLRDLITASGSEKYASEDARIARCLADYIASLTEDQALDLHGRLYGQIRASIDATWVAY